jgi:hypothetical protein
MKGGVETRVFDMSQGIEEYGKVSTSTLTLVMKMRTKRKSSTQTKCFS